MAEPLNDSTTSAASDGYDAFRAAGEMYGRLRLALGFGELSMRSTTTRAVEFAWSFKANGKEYWCEQSIDLDYVRCEPSLDALAERMAEEFKNEHRQLSS